MLQSTAMNPIVANFNNIQRQISTTLQTCGRDAFAVTLVAVSKSQTSDQIATLFAAGQHSFGENYLDEALPKISALPLPGIIWHFIGRVQSRKAQEIAQNFSWVHTVCRFKEAALLSEHRASLPALNICLQVKLDDDPKPHGIPKRDVLALVEQIKPLPNLSLRGLMVLPPFANDVATQRHYFRELRSLYDQCNQQGANFDTLSMGMTHDFEAAILEGATMLRIGTGIFGPRR
ncbi:MAG TPA: YggS family pyridoxal phosphate-dependent enzyme [Methylotenera sp.]|nr:YggS family pyridoxal phosphate-dependent enzyme [Methylotenera sp.]